MSKIKQNGKTSLRRPKLLIKEAKHLMKKKKHVLIFIFIAGIWEDKSTLNFFMLVIMIC